MREWEWDGQSWVKCMRLVRTRTCALRSIMQLRYRRTHDNKVHVYETEQIASGLFSHRQARKVHRNHAVLNYANNQAYAIRLPRIRHSYFFSNWISFYIILPRWFHKTYIHKTVLRKFENHREISILHGVRISKEKKKNERKLRKS